MSWPTWQGQPGGSAKTLQTGVTGWDLLQRAVDVQPRFLATQAEKLNVSSPAYFFIVVACSYKQNRAAAPIASMSHRDRDRDEPYSRDKGSSRYSFEKKADAAPKVFVGNIPYTTSDEEVKAHFESAGRVQEVLVRVAFALGRGQASSSAGENGVGTAAVCFPLAV